MRFLAQASVARMTQSGSKGAPSCNSLKRGHCFSARHLTRIDFRPDSSAILLNRLVFKQTLERGLHILSTSGAVNLKSAAQALDARGIIKLIVSKGRDQLWSRSSKGLRHCTDASVMNQRFRVRQQPAEGA
ncbi:MAG: hypothetical protein QOJ51_1278 [Acidobacteriaceae bacterium]|jgi:hypothetical protein|nr:hypothetical protein [Acidobacteriaceae bacterium]MDX6462838.1 hypothetical protein [Acidobacteriaceae bacterium]MEA2258453.1 hypothetical protein [Acidobacteriaceae bacterium]